MTLKLKVNLFIYLGFYVAFNTVQVISQRVVGRAEDQYIQFVRVLYCKLPTNGKQLPAFPLEAVPGTKPRPQRWEVRVLPLCHRGPKIEDQGHKTIVFVALPIYTHIPNLKGLTKIFFKLSRPKGNLCSGGVTIMNLKYPRLSSGDTMTIL